MIITLLILALILSGALSWFAESRKAGSAKMVALVSSLFLALSFIVYC